MTQLFHYTCQHGRDGIGDLGVLLTPDRIKAAHGRQKLFGIYAELDGLIWMTDLERPHREGLGLRNAVSECDRTAFRYQVLDAAATVRYITVRRDLNRTLVELLEAAPGAMPMHWWVARFAVPVEHAPIEGAAS